MLALQHVCTWSFLKFIRHVRRRIKIIIFSIILVIFLFKWGFICIDLQPKIHLKRLCASYKKEELIGNLCDALCQLQDSSSISCHNFYMEKEAVFSGTWQNQTVVFKSIQRNVISKKKLSTFSPINNTIMMSETLYTDFIKKVIKTKFNLSINDVDAKRMSYIQYSQEGGNRFVEMQNVWSLLQDNEYLALSLYEKYDVFPKLLGTCGPLYAVEKLNSISGYWHLVAPYDSQKEWDKRLKISIMILDFLNVLENSFPEPMLLCDVKMNNFGVTSDFKKIKYLDLDSVHPKSVASKMTADGSYCEHHSDCDLIDCRSYCNLLTKKCHQGIINNNLQIVCEKIFLGWMMSHKIMVPGLLVGDRAPRVLIQVLEDCANPYGEEGIPRASAMREVKDTLYNLLVNLRST